MKDDLALDDVRRLHTLSQTILDATEWRDTFDDRVEQVVFFGNIAMGEARESGRQGWEGELAVPKDIAIEMLGWLETRARTELAAMRTGDASNQPEREGGAG